jgi:phage terminase large subunit
MVKLQFDTYWNEKQKLAFEYLFWHHEITEIWYGGAAWWGKSYTGVSWQWMMCNKYPWYRGFFWREELKRLKQTTLATYFKFVSDYKIPESQKWVYNAQDSVIKFSNGSEILLLDLAYLPSDPLYTRFGSLELSGGYIDESAEVSEQCISILSTRVWRQKNEEYWIPPKILEWFNPDKWHVYRRYYLPDKNGTMPTYRVFIKALATDNKRLPKSYIQQLEKTNEVTKQRLLYGNFEYDDTPWRLFEYNAIQNLWNNWMNLGDYYVTCDAARKGKDKAIIKLWRGWHVVKLIEFAKCETTDIEDEIKKLQVLYWFPMSRVVVDEDGVGGGIVDHLWCVWFVNNSTAIVQEGSDFANYKNLKTQCYFLLAEKVNSGGISIEPTYFKDALTQELDVVVQVNMDKDQKKEICDKEYIKEKIGRSPDYADAMMMRMIFVLIDKNRSFSREWVGIQSGRTPILVKDNWTYYEKRIPGHKYVIGCTLSEGASIVVIDCTTKQVVAEYYNQFAIPDTVGTQLSEKGYLYNTAYIGVHADKYGQAVVSILKSKNYPAIYQNMNETGYDDDETDTLWVILNPKTKGVIITQLALAIKHLTILVPSNILLQEIEEYPRENAEKMDDEYIRVVSLAIAYDMTKKSGFVHGKITIT